MATEMIDELRQFHSYLSEKLKEDGVALSPEEALDDWRRTHPLDEALEEEIAAIQQALDDMANGDRGIPFDEFEREFRKRNNLSA